MAKEYKAGERYYLPVTVKSILDGGYKYPVGIEFVDSEGYETTEETAIANEPDLLLTGYEVYECQVTALKDEIATLKSENERLSKQNEELGTKVDGLETELENAKSLNEFAVKVEQNMTKQVAEQRELMKKYSVVIDVLIDKITALRKGENNG